MDRYEMNLRMSELRRESWRMAIALAALLAVLLMMWAWS
jgi:hypothetical protein